MLKSMIKPGFPRLRSSQGANTPILNQQDNNDYTSDLIVLCSTRNAKILSFQVRMLNSFCQHTPKECKMLVLENNSSYNNHKDWKGFVESHGQRFEYLDCDFNMNKMYNIGTRMTNNKFVMYANSDILFYKDWYYNLLKWYYTIDNLFVISPFTRAFKRDKKPQGVYRRDVTPKNFFYETIHMPGWFYCFRRDSNFVWDERFRAHYQDNDFVRTVEKLKKERNIRSGIAYNSRVDHMGGQTHKSARQDYYGLDGRKKMIEKWGRSSVR